MTPPSGTSQDEGLLEDPDALRARLESIEEAVHDIRDFLALLTEHLSGMDQDDLLQEIGRRQYSAERRSQELSKAIGTLIEKNERERAVRSTSGSEGDGGEEGEG